MFIVHQKNEACFGRNVKLHAKSTTLFVIQRSALQVWEGGGEEGGVEGKGGGVH